MSKGGKKGFMHEGMKNMSPPGDSGARPPKGHVNDASTRDSVSKSHSIGGRVA